MKFLILLMSLLFTNPMFATTDTTVKAYSSGGLFFLQIPAPNPDLKDVSSWLVVDEQGQCRLVNSNLPRSAESSYGHTVYDSTKDVIYYLAVDRLFGRDLGADQWTDLGAGSFLSDKQWVQSATATNGDVAEIYGAWLSDQIRFLNDPRPSHKQYWFQVGPHKSCYRFSEKSRVLDSKRMQTVRLDSGSVGVPAWTLTTGFASLGLLDVVGNWFNP